MILIEKRRSQMEAACGRELRIEACNSVMVCVLLWAASLQTVSGISGSMPICLRRNP